MERLAGRRRDSSLIPLAATDNNAELASIATALYDVVQHDISNGSLMINTIAEFSKKEGLHPEPGTGGRLKRRLARIGRSMFGLRLEIGLGVTAVVAPFVRPTIASKPSELCLKAVGLCLVLTGLRLRAWAAGFAGRHTRSSKIEGSKLATAGPYAYVRNPIYLGSVILGFGMVLLIGDRRLWAPCTLTFLALYFGLIPAEEEFLSQKFPGEYEAYCRHVPRLLPRLSARAAAGVVKVRFDRRAAYGECRLGLVLAVILGVFRTIAVSCSRRRGRFTTLRSVDNENPSG
jgi:protein-S-isoprenylcysteine O-methyltransferase Ste14